MIITYRLMGSTFALGATNLFMVHLEHLFILNATQNHLFRHLAFYFQFIDDTFCVYMDPGTKDNFLSWVSTIHPSIKSTLQA